MESICFMRTGNTVDARSKALKAALNKCIQKERWLDEATEKVDTKE